MPSAPCIEDESKPWVKAFKLTLHADIDEAAEQDDILLPQDHPERQL